MFDEIQQYLQMNSTTSDNTYKTIICSLTSEIIKLKQELFQYKSFHDAILENEVIKNKFREYELLIKEMNEEIQILKARKNCFD